MKEQEKQKLFDFVDDLISLAKTYGWSLDVALDKIGWKQKDKYDLMVDELFEKLWKEKEIN